MVLFVNLLGKGLTQEINRDGGSLMGSCCALILHETNVKPLMKREYRRKVLSTFTIFVRKFELAFHPQIDDMRIFDSMD